VGRHASQYRSVVAQMYFLHGKEAIAQTLVHNAVNTLKGLRMRSEILESLVVGRQNLRECLKSEGYFTLLDDCYSDEQPNSNIFSLFFKSESDGPKAQLNRNAPLGHYKCGKVGGRSETMKQATVFGDVGERTVKQATVCGEQHLR
jgi:hypothetical protein